jgi:hypothetical protein
VHTFDAIEDLRRTLQGFTAHYNATWLAARHGYRPTTRSAATSDGLLNPKRPIYPWPPDERSRLSRKRVHYSSRAA